MDTIKQFTHPTKVIMHFAEDEGRGRLVHYQAIIETDVSAYSPCGEFIRFNFSSENGEPVNEINGWIRISSIIIDSYLEELVEDEWRLVANG